MRLCTAPDFTIVIVTVLGSWQTVLGSAIEPLPTLATRTASALATELLNVTA